MSIADRIAVMNRGRIEQLDAPVEIYDRPATLFVNSFVGSCSLLDGRVEARTEAGYRVRLAQGATVLARSRQDLANGHAVVVSARPEQLAPVRAGRRGSLSRRRRAEPAHGGQRHP